ncbi:MAG TPA: GNAT family N-acetyltransferase [Lentisphaeria bacterium]|uniref:GNAT family N-acetyltransferase n=1 Tax=uncultured Victivallis sp. TaxID=354118 RepID=UPI000E99BCAB|nr:GNAT family N-acetyltransferase [uncultured Victivallis sp.]HBP05070.1 GNAT family N-acetyltransferase [Lentisphaeria bacterium]HCH85196.1 GNAT family N-acetyltransferase [Lentisphaeria bacterium]
MTEAIRIRPAAEEDLPELVELLRQLFELEQDFEPDASKQQAGLSLMLESPFAELLVAECGGRVAGFCGVQLQISTAMGSYAAQIEDLVLHPEFRRRGIGSRLLDAAGAWAKQRGARRLQLNCDDQNLPAMRFYEARNWIRTHLFNYFKFNF